MSGDTCPTWQSPADSTVHRQVRLLLIDSLVLFRASLSWILSTEPGIKIAGECGTAAEGLRFLRDSRQGVDLVLLDPDLQPGHSGNFITAARELGYKGRFLIVAASLDARTSALALSAGASGIFLKSDQLGRLLQAIRTIMDGDIWIDRTIVRLLANQLIDRWPAPLASDGCFGSKEQKVLMGVAQGLSNRSIGISLGISESAVKNSVQRLFNKTGVRRRSQLVRMAVNGSLGTLRLPETRAPQQVGRMPLSGWPVIDPPQPQLYEPG